MIEIILIFFQILFIGSLTFLSIPKIKRFNIQILSLVDEMAIKLLILMNIFLLFSLTSLNHIYLLILLLSSSIYILFISKDKLSLKIDIKIFYIFLIIFIISISMANDLEFSWDAKFFWFLKTITFYQNDSFLHLDKLPASDYPHLGSYLWSFFWKFPFNTYEYSGRIFYIFFYVICVFSFCEIFNTNKLNKIIISSLIIIISYSNELFSGNQEIIIFSLILISAKFSYQLISLEKKLDNLNIITLLLSFNAAIWIKNEGLFLLGFMPFLLVFLAKLSLNQKQIIIFGSISLVILRLLVFKFLNTDLESFEFDKTFNSSFFKNLFVNIKIIVFYSLVYLTSLPLILIGLLLLFYNLYTFKLDKTQIFIGSYTILNIFFIFAAFFFTMQDVEWQVRVGLKRVMFETSGFYLLTIAYLFNKTQKQ